MYVHVQVKHRSGIRYVTSSSDSGFKLQYCRLSHKPMAAATNPFSLGPLPRLISWVENRGAARSLTHAWLDTYTLRRRIEASTSQALDDYPYETFIR